MIPMILALEATDRGGSIALAENGDLLDLDFRDSDVTHSERLMPVIDDVLNRRNRTYEDIDRIVVARGPGSFTAIRLAVTTAKTLAITCNVPLVAPTTLRVMTEYAGARDGSIVSVLDARRGELYVQEFRRRDGQIRAAGEPELMDPEDLTVTADTQVVFRGRELDRSDLEEVPPEAFVPGPLSRPLALALVSVAAQENRVDDRAPDGVTPCYVRKSDAQRNGNGGN